MFDNFTPKAMILDSLTSKFEGTGIDKILMQYFIVDDKYNIMLQTGETATKLELAENELNMVKKILINKIIKVFQKKNPNVLIKSIIVQFDINLKELKLFIEDNKNSIIKFEF